MATQITYKGAQIASLTTGTKVLKTAGKYMEDDVTVSAQGSAEAISIIDEPDSHGGTIRHINGVSLESDTVSAEVLLSGYTAHDSEGNVVNGTLVIQHYYTGSSAPSSSTGIDGDIYLQTS